MAEVQGIDFEINGSSNSATDAIERLIQALNTLTSAFEKASSESSGVAGSLGRVASAARSLGDSAKKVEPLSDELIEFITNANKLELAGEKMEVLEAKLEKAFRTGNLEGAVNIQNQILNLEESMAKMSEAADEIRPVSDAMRDLVSNADKVDLLTIKLERLEEEMNRAFDAGDTDKAIRLREKILSLESSLEKLTETEEETTEATETMSNGIETSGGEASNVAKRFRSLASAIGRMTSKALRFVPVVSGFKSISSAVSGLSSKISGLAGRFKRLLIMRTFRAMIRAVVQGFKEGIQNLYDWSNAMGGEFAASMDQAATSLQYLKNSIGAMAAPLINALVPVLDYVIDKVVDLINFINMLFAKLTGASYWTKAIKVARSYGEAATDAANSAGNAAKEALRYLAPFDELNVLPSASGSGGGGGSGGGSGGSDAGMMFETVALDDALSGLDDFLERLKNIGNVFKQAWNTSGAAVLASIQSAFNSIKQVISDVGDSFYRVFTGGYGYAWLTSAFNLLTNIFNLIGSIADAFDEAWNEDHNGDKFFESVFDSMTALNNLASTFVSTFQSAWNNEDRGKTFFTNLIKIATNLNNIVTNIANGISTAWDEHGEAIWGNVLDAVNSVVSAIEDVTSATAEWAEDVDFENLITSVENITGAFADLVDELSGDFAYVWKNYLLPFAQWSIEEGIPETINLIAEAIRTLSTAIDYVKPFAKLLDSYVLQPLANLQRQQFEMTVDGLTTGLTNLRDVMENGVDTENFGGLMGGLLEYFIGTSGNPGLVLAYEKLKPFVEMIVDFVNMDTTEGTRNWKSFFTGLANLAIGALNSAIEGINQFLADTFDTLGINIDPPKIPLIGLIEEVEDEIPEKDKKFGGFGALFGWAKDQIKDGDKSFSGFSAFFDKFKDGIPDSDKSLGGGKIVAETMSDKIPAADKTVTGTFAGKTDSSFTTAKEGFDAVKNNTATKTISGKTGESFKYTSTQYKGVASGTATKSIFGKIGDTFKAAKSSYSSVTSNSATKTLYGAAPASGKFTEAYNAFRSITSNYATKTLYGSAPSSGGFTTAYNAFRSITSDYATKTLYGKAPQNGGFTAAYNAYHSLQDKTVTVTINGRANGVAAGGGYYQWTKGVADSVNANVNTSVNANNQLDENGVYRAVLAALNNSDLGGDIVLDGKVLYQNVVTRNKQNTKRTGVNALA